MEELVQGIQYEWEDENTLVLKIDVSREVKASRSGNNVMLATTHGNVPMEMPDGGEMFTMVNIFTPRMASRGDRMDTATKRIGKAPAVLAKGTKKPKADEHVNH